MLPLMTARDWFAFGGFCITGMMRSLMPAFIETVTRVCNVLLAETPVRRVHLLGVCYPDAVIAAAAIARQRGIEISTDSRAPETAGCIYGKTYCTTTGRQQEAFTQEEKWTTYHPNELAHQNVHDYTAWCRSLATSASSSAQTSP